MVGMGLRSLASLPHAFSWLTPIIWARLNSNTDFTLASLNHCSQRERLQKPSNMNCCHIGQPLCAIRLMDTTETDGYPCIIIDQTTDAWRKTSFMQVCCEHGVCPEATGAEKRPHITRTAYVTNVCSRVGNLATHAESHVALCWHTCLVFQQWLGQSHDLFWLFPARTVWFFFLPWSCDLTSSGTSLPGSCSTSAGGFLSTSFALPLLFYSLSVSVSISLSPSPCIFFLAP